MHRIRLGLAWRLHVLSCDTGLQPPDSDGSGAKFDLPARGEWLIDVADDASFELRRFFNRPSNLVDEQSVALVFTGLANRARIILNDSVLMETSTSDSSGADVISFEIREKLRPRNELIIAFSSPASFRQPGAIILETASLEIESDPGDDRE